MNVDKEKALETEQLEEVVLEKNDPVLEEVHIDPVAEKKLLRKIDLRLIPPLWSLFLLSFLDRTNIGALEIDQCNHALALTLWQEMQKFKVSQRTFE